mmetsp:Transcript_14089/g.20829  ORF Transcript_14089/g.20829 Transcript_14089/m.20829 type:complete len:195 (-) Transcript_14089:86-670(-)
MDSKVVHNNGQNSFSLSNRISSTNQTNLNIDKSIERGKIINSNQLNQTYASKGLNQLGSGGLNVSTLNIDSSKLNRTRSINSQKNEQFGSFLKELDEYSPTVPEAMTQYFLRKGGCGSSDERLLKLVSMAADKYLASLIYDSMLNQSSRSSNSEKSKKKENFDNVLEYQDLAMSLKERGIEVREFKNLDKTEPK